MAGAPQQIFDDLENYLKTKKQKKEDMSSLAKTARGTFILTKDHVIEQTKRNHFQMLWEDYSRNIDVILMPTCVTPAFKHDHRKFKDRSLFINRQKREYWDLIIWAGIAIAVIFL